MNVRRLWALVMCVAVAGPVARLPGAEAGAQDAAPVLTIVEPDSQTTLVGVVRMRAEVVPADRVETVEFFVDGVPACVAPAPPFDCSWDAGPRAAAHVVRVVARLLGGERLVRSIRTPGRTATFFSAGTSMILVPVVVQDRRGRFVEGLTLDDFEVLEDGVRQEPSFFEPANVPLDLVLAVDFSASMAGSMAALRFAARQFIATLPASARLGLLAFNDRIFVAARQEPDRAVVTQAVDALPEPFGGTALLDAIVHALGLHGDGFAHKAVVLFSDGDDQDSLTAIEQAEQRIRASQATVHVVTLGRGRAIERVRTLLGRLTRVSGGRSFAIERIDDLNDALAHIQENLRDRYFLAYEPSNPNRDGTWRRIEVRTGNHRHVVTAREGYLAEPVF